MSGKTGTAEDGEGGLDHAWFVCFAPSEKSELLVVAFAQNKEDCKSKISARSSQL